MTLKEKLGSNIKDLMRQKSVSQQELANHVGVHQTSVSFWLKGEKTPHFDTLEKIAEYLDTSVAELLDDGSGKSAVIEHALQRRPELEPLLYEASKVPPKEVDFAIELLKRINSPKK